MPSLAMVFDLLAVDRASAVFDRVGGSAAAAGREVEASTGSMAAAGSKMAAGLGIAGAAIAVISAKMAGDFQQNITKLETTAGESKANLQMVGDGILSMAGQVGVGAIELSKGMYTIESSGIHGADALNVLKAAAQGARQENADLGKVTDAVTTALHDYSLPASEAANVTSMMVAAVSTGKTTFDELTGSLHSVTPMAAALHVPFADIIGDLAAMTASGMSADQATQNMAQALRSLQNPTKPMIDELAQLGINAADLGSMLGTKGLSGTIQFMSQAILEHMGPSGKVLLGTFNQSKIAAEDAKIMFDHLPPAIQTVAKAYESGNLSVRDWRTAIKDMPADQQTLAMSWKNMTDTASGFTQALKSGKPDTQEFNAALTKVMGTAPGLSVALQLTGEHAAVLNENIKMIAGSTADASGNIKGWSEVQGNFNQQLAQAGASVESMAIQLGQKLLPGLTGAFGFINTTVLPGIKSLGGLVGDAAGAFGKLPAPIKEVTIGLGLLAAANAVGAISGIVNAVERLGAGVAAIPGKLKDFASGWGPLAIGVAGVAAAVLASKEQIDDWASGLEQGGKAAQTATDQMDDAHTRSIASAHSLGDAWAITKGAFSDGLAQIEGYSSALDAASQKAQDMYNAMPLQKRVQQDVTTAQNDLNQAIDDYGQNSSAAKYQAWLLGLANDSLKINQQELKVAVDGTNGSLNGQIGLQEQLARGGQNYDEAIYNTGKAIDSYTASMKLGKKHTDEQHQALDNVTQSFFGVLDAAKRKADAETQGMPQAMIVNQEIVRQRDALDQVVQQLGFVPPALQGMYDSLNGPTAKALQATQTNVNNMGTAMTTVSNNDIGGTFLPALDKIAKAAGTTVPQAITGGFIPSTDQMAGQINGPTVTALATGASWMDYWHTQMANSLPGAIQGPFAGALKTADGHMANTGGQAQITAGQVAGLGQDIIGLPGSHNTVITADATQANNTINDFLTRMNRDGFVGAQFNLTPLGAPAPAGGLIGLPPVPHKATGGPIAGPGTGTSDSVLIAASNGEHMWTAAEVSAAGGHAAVEGIRKAVLAAGHGLAGGGPVPTSVDYPFDLNSGVKARLAAQEAAAAAAAAFTSSAGGDPAMRALGQQIAANMGWASQFAAIDYVFSHESGWNPNAQNPTSTAYGIPQFLNGTWAQYGGKTSSPGLQITDGINYMVDRYGSPNGAQAFWARNHWYDNGGWLQPGVTMAMNGTGKPERIRTAEQEASLQRQLSGTVIVNVIDRDGTFVERMRGEIDHALGSASDSLHYAGG